jgi:hypothetical protein
MELDMNDIRPSLFSWVMVGLMAITFIFFAKYLVNQYNLFPLTFVKDVVNAV